MEKYTKEEQRQNRDRWAAVLRSGKFMQVYRALYDGKNGRCVMGVGIETMKEDNVIPETNRCIEAYYGMSSFTIFDLARDNDAGFTFNSLAIRIDSINLQEERIRREG